MGVIMNLDRINIINHELNNFRNKITRLEEELASIENNDVLNTTNSVNLFI